MCERKIVIAIDNSEQADHAFQWYIQTIHKSENKVVLVHVPEVTDADKSRMLYVSHAAWQEAMSKEQTKMKELEDKYNSRILELGLSGTVRCEPGSKPGEALVRIAEEEQATMIVMGTRGLGKVRRTIMGSVSDYVVHHAHCPVIVCRQ